MGVGVGVVGVEQIPAPPRLNLGQLAQCPNYWWFGGLLYIPVRSKDKLQNYRIEIACNEHEKCHRNCAVHRTVLAYIVTREVETTVPRSLPHLPIWRFSK